MPKDLITPSQQWNTQDQFEQSKIINTQNEQDKLKKLQNEQDFNSLAEKEQKAWEKLKKYEADGYDMSMHYDKFKTIGADSGKVERAYNGFRKFTSEGATTLSNILNEDDSQYRNNVREVKLREDNWKQRQSELNPNEYKTKEDVWNVAGGVGEATPYVAGGVAMGVSKAPTFLGKLAGDIGRGAVADAYLGTLQHGYKENFDSEIAKEVGLGVAGQTVGTGLAHLLSKVGGGDVLTPKNPQTEVTDKINKEYASSSVENKVGDSISSSDNITPDSVAKKINDIYFGGKNIIEDTQPVRSDMPIINNQQANKVNDFFNPVDKNRVQAQGNADLPTPASQQDPFVYQPKQADTFGWEKDAQRNNDLQQLREKISPLNDVLKINETKSLMGVKREDPNDISFPLMSKQKQMLPDVLPLDNKEEMKSIIRYAKDNNAVDEFISKLPPNKRVDEVQKFFDNLKPTQQKQDGIVQVRTNIKEPTKTYDSNALNEFEGLTKATGMNTSDVLSLEKPTSTAGVRNSIIRYEQGTATQRDFEILDAVNNFMKHEGDNFRTKVNQPRYKPDMNINDAVANNMDYETANRMGAIPFSNGSQTFGGAAVGGTHAIATGQDYNNDGKTDYKDGLIGALIGAVGVSAARKIMPNAFKDKNIDRNIAGMFVGKSPTDTKDLMIQHNLSQENLRYANSRGGIAAPSLATVKKDMPIDGFGDITLIGDKALATPSKDMKAFASDIYSPRHPRERREYNQSDIRKIDNSLIDYIHKTGGGDVSTSNDVAELMNNVALKAKFLEEQKGISLKIPNRVNPQEQTLKQFYKSEYTASVSNKGLDYQTLARDPNFQAKVAKELQAKYIDNEKVLNTMLQPDRLFNLAKDRAMNLDQIGRSQNKPDLYKARELVNKHMSKHQDEFDNYVKNIQESYSYKSSFNNNGKQQPYTEQNVMKYLTSNLRGGENFNHGAGSIRATVTPEFKTIEQIKKAKERLVTSKEFESIKSTIDNELGDIISKIADDGIGNSFTAREIASEFISDYAKRGKRALSDYSVKVKPEDFAEIDNFLNKLKEMPTEYFESKFLGKMELNKFKLAIIPKNASKETKEILEKNGIKYKTYDPKMPESRIEVIKREAEKNNVLFASPTISGGMVGGFTGMGNDIDQDGKITYKDVLYGALGGAGIGKGASSMVNKQNISSAIERVKNSDFANNMYHFRIDKQKDYLKSRETAQREINKTMQEAEELHFALKELPEQDRKNMYKYMTGESVSISEAQKSLIDNVREKITELGKKLVDEKILDEKAFEDWKDVYIHRNYEKHLFKGLKENVSRAFNDAKTLQPIYKRGKVSTIANNDIHAAIEMMSDAGYFKKNDAINIKSMNELVELSKAIPISKGGVDFKRLPDGKFEIRRDWTRAEREKMGEIEDVAFAIPETISRLQELVSHAKFLKEVPENVIGDTSKFTPEELKNSGFIKLDGTRYGALNGRFVQKDIARDIGMVSRQLMGSDFQWERLYSEYLTMFKKSHTVYNPSAHINNMTSNITLQYMEGVNPQDIAKNIKNSIGVVDKVQKVKELKAKTKLYELPSDKKELDMLLGDKDVKLWYDSEANGLFGRSELNDVLMRYANKGEDNNKGLSGLLKNLAGNKTSTIAEKADRFASNLYQHEDNFNRFTLLKYFVNDKKMNLEDAISKVNTVIPDYTKPMARVPDWLRRTGVTPFIAWTYYATPILMRQMKEHPARAMALMGLMYGSYASNGINPFDEKDMPQDGWAFKRVPLPFGASTDGSKVTTVKVDKAMPHMELLNMFKPSDNMFVPQFIKDQLSGGIPQSLIGWMFNYNPYFNTKITYSNDTGAKAYHLGKHFVQNLLPTPDILDSAYNLGETAVLSKEVRKTQKAVEPRTQTENILKSLGINLMTYDKQKQKKKVIDDEIKRIKDKKP